VTSLFDQHRDTLDKAIDAIHTRAYFSAYPEVPSGKIYGENARDEGQAAFKAAIGSTFDLDQPGSSGTVGAERSPFGFDLNVKYPKPNLELLLPAAKKAMDGWKHASVEERTGICLEILHRLNKRSFELAFAVMHTTGQGFMMAFQAGGPHAQDRALEAIAYAYDAMHDVPRQVTWSKKVSKTDTVHLEKTFRLVPRGISAVVACSTFPTWNSYPAIFASLVTGNAVVVKPHPGAALPLALTVKIAREVIAEAGFDPNIITLAADAPDAPITKELVTHEDVQLVDYTGGSEFGEWIEQNAKQAVVFTEKAGVNSAVIDSIEDMRAVSGNLAFTLSLYSGQMCTTTQNIYIPRDGIDVGGNRVSFDEVANAIVGGIDWLLGDPKRGAEILGAVQNEHTSGRVGEAKAEGGDVLRESGPIENEHFPDARVCSPLVLKVDAKDRNLYWREMFGPIVYIIATDDTNQSIDLASQCARELGAITAAVYSTDSDVLARAEEALTDAGAPVSCNLTGQIYVNQSAAFSDYHVSGANPSGNATLTDAAFVAPRFRVVQSRVPVQVAEPVGA